MHGSNRGLSNIQGLDLSRMPDLRSDIYIFKIRGGMAKRESYNAGRGIKRNRRRNENAVSGQKKKQEVLVDDGSLRSF